MSETAVWRIIMEHLPKKEPPRYGVLVNVGQERSVERWTVKIIFKWPSLSLLLS